MTDETLLSASVVVVTYDRPDYVRTCLEHLTVQTRTPFEICVVDSSPHEKTHDVVREFAGVQYLRNELGRGYMATSRAIGVAHTSGDVVVFIDDDAYAEPDWLGNLLAPYADGNVGAVGGRADNGITGEEHEGLDQVGLLLDDGTLTGNFAGDTGAPVRVEHLLGANMSYRRTALAAIGGIHDHWPGTSLREDADTGIRMVQAGYDVLYTPRAVVFHVGGSYAKGRRFDLRYYYYGARNHVVLLHHSLGGRDPRTRHYASAALKSIGRELAYAARAVRETERTPYRKLRGLGRGTLQAVVIFGGTVAGYLAAPSVDASREHPAHPLATVGRQR